MVEKGVVVGCGWGVIVEVVGNGRFSRLHQLLIRFIFGGRSDVEIGGRNTAVAHLNRAQLIQRLLVVGLGLGVHPGLKQIGDVAGDIVDFPFAGIGTIVGRVVTAAERFPVDTVGHHWTNRVAPTGMAAGQTGGWGNCSE